jgi:hypothetical protein
MDKIIISDVEVALGPISNKPFGTQKRNIQLDESGLLFESKKFDWASLKTVEVDFFIGNPYVQCHYGEDTVVSLWFPSKWYKLRKKPWFTTSEQLTTEFIDKIEEFTDHSALKEKILNKINDNSTSKSSLIYHWGINLIYIFLPISALYLLISFILWVFANPGGVFEI